MSMTDSCERCSAHVSHRGDHLCVPCAKLLDRSVNEPFWGDFANHPDAKYRPTISACIADFAAVPPAIGRDIAGTFRDFAADLCSAWRDFVWMRQLKNEGDRS